jgi:hypothetical protein
MHTKFHNIGLVLDHTEKQHNIGLVLAYRKTTQHPLTVNEIISENAKSRRKWIHCQQEIFGASPGVTSNWFSTQ